MSNSIILGEAEKSHIEVSSRHIRVVLKQETRALNPLGVVTILPGIQLELGRDINELVECIRYLETSLTIHNIYSANGFSTWEVLNFVGKNKDDFQVCTISTINNCIASVTFNQNLLYDSRYRQSARLSAMHLLTAGKIKDMQISKAIRAVTSLTLRRADEFRVRHTNNTIVVYTNIPELVYQYKFVFIKDRQDYFNLLSVGFLEGME